MTFLLRPAVETDIDFLLDLRLVTMDAHLRAMGVCFSREQHRERVLLEFEHARVITVNDEAIGMVKYLRKDDALHLQQLQVLPEWQGRGIGRQVMDHLIALAEADGLPVTLTVLKKNPALALYQRCGFEQVGEDEFEYHLRCEPAVGERAG